MRDDETEDDLVPPPEDPTTALLERLDEEGLVAPDEALPPSPALSRREIDTLLDQVLDEELKRLNNRKG